MLLKNGCKGQEVARLQAMLGGINVDGVFGLDTENAVKSYQNSVGINPDGIAGIETQIAIGMPILKGIDISHHNGNIRWGEVSGIDFVIAKATEGMTFVDDSFYINRDGARSRGISFGAYHYGRPNNNYIADFTNYAKTVGKQIEIPPALDLEETGGLNNRSLTEWARNWLLKASDYYGAKPVLYVGSSFVKKLQTKSFMNICDLWIANWNGNGMIEPDVPNGFNNWNYWQYSSSGRVSGISGDVDLDYRSSFASTP